jgi:hypothetical protein
MGGSVLILAVVDVVAVKSVAAAVPAPRTILPSFVRRGQISITNHMRRIVDSSFDVFEARNFSKLQDVAVVVKSFHPLQRQ